MLKVMRHYYVPNVKDQYIVATLKAGKTFLKMAQDYSLGLIEIHPLERDCVLIFFTFCAALLYEVGSGC